MKDCFIVVFSNKLHDNRGYANMAKHLDELVEKQPGFIRQTSVRDENGVGTTVSYWESEEAIKQWKESIDHVKGQEMGKKRFYEYFDVTVAKVTRSYHWERG